MLQYKVYFVTSPPHKVKMTNTRPDAAKTLIIHTESIQMVGFIFFRTNRVDGFAFIILKIKSRGIHVTCNVIKTDRTQTDETCM